MVKNDNKNSYQITIFFNFFGTFQSCLNPFMFYKRNTQQLYEIGISLDERIDSTLLW